MRFNRSILWWSKAAFIIIGYDQPCYAMDSVGRTPLNPPSPSCQTLAELQQLPGKFLSLSRDVQQLKQRVTQFEKATQIWHKCTQELGAADPRNQLIDFSERITRLEKESLGLCNKSPWGNRLDGLEGTLAICVQEIAAVKKQDRDIKEELDDAMARLKDQHDVDVLGLEHEIDNIQEQCDAMSDYVNHKYTGIQKKMELKNLHLLKPWLDRLKQKENCFDKNLDYLRSLLAAHKKLLKAAEQSQFAHQYSESRLESLENTNAFIVWFSIGAFITTLLSKFNHYKGMIYRSFNFMTDEEEADATYYEEQEEI